MIDTFTFDSALGYEPDIIPVSGSVYVIAYRGSASDGFLTTVNIATSGAITHSIVDTYNFDTSSGYEPTLIYLSGNIYVVAYRGGNTSTIGYIKTFQIATDSSNTYQITSTALGVTVTATVVINNGSSAVTAWTINK